MNRPYESIGATRGRKNEQTYRPMVLVHPEAGKINRPMVAVTIGKIQWV